MCFFRQGKWLSNVQHWNEADDAHLRNSGRFTIRQFIRPMRHATHTKLIYHRVESIDIFSIDIMYLFFFITTIICLTAFIVVNHVKTSKSNIPWRAQKRISVEGEREKNILLWIGVEWTWMNENGRNNVILIFYMMCSRIIIRFGALHMR